REPASGEIASEQATCLGRIIMSYHPVEFSVCTLNGRAHRKLRIAECPKDVEAALGRQAKGHCEHGLRADRGAVKIAVARKHHALRGRSFILGIERVKRLERTVRGDAK